MVLVDLAVVGLLLWLSVGLLDMIRVWVVVMFGVFIWWLVGSVCV